MPGQCPALIARAGRFVVPRWQSAERGRFVRLRDRPPGPNATVRRLVRTDSLPQARLLRKALIRDGLMSESLHKSG